MHAGLCWYFHNPLDSDMNYGICNVCMWSILNAYTHGWPRFIVSPKGLTHFCVNLVTSDSMHCLGTETSNRTFKQEYIIIIIENFCIVLFSGVHKLTALYITGKDPSPSLFQGSAQITHPLTNHYSQLKCLPPIPVSKFTWLVLDVNGMYLYKVLFVTCSCGFGSSFSFLGWLYVNGMYLYKVLFVTCSLGSGSSFFSLDWLPGFCGGLSACLSVLVGVCRTCAVGLVWVCVCVCVSVCVCVCVEPVPLDWCVCVCVCRTCAVGLVCVCVEPVPLDWCVCARVELVQLDWCVCACMCV